MNTTYTAKIGCINTGTTPSAQVTLNGTEFIFNFTLPKGDKGEKGDKGDDGLNGGKGEQGDTGYALPAGGAEGQVLVKESNDDYETTWKDPSSLTINLENEIMSRLLPTGGSQNQVLVKGNSGSATWKNAIFATGSGSGSGGNGGGGSVIVDDSNFVKLTGQESQTIDGVIKVNGYVDSVGGFYERSDIRLKNVIGNADIDIEKIINLSIVYFTFKNDDKNKQHIGVIAQEIAQICPEMVERDKDGYLSVDYSKLSLLCLFCLKDLYGKVNKK